MNIFTIITTLLNLTICTYAAFKKENPTYNQQIALIKDPTLIFSPHISAYNSPCKDVAYDNYKFKSLLLYYSVFTLLGVIFFVWFIHGWNAINSSMDILAICTKFIDVLSLSLLNTSKCSILSICVFSCGLIYKNHKNHYSSYRIFHLISYSLLTVCVMANFFFLLITNHKFFSKM